jgi:hypothetical protein
MASRFDLDVLADAYVEFLRRHEGRALTSEEAAQVLLAHTEFALTDETLRAPRIVLIASRFPVNVTASCVWLSEMGLSLTLTRVQAYRTAGEVIITVSQQYPTPDVEDFLVAPTRASRRARAATNMPEADWTPEDLQRLADEVNSVTIHVTLDVCSSQPGEWVASETIQGITGRLPAKHRGDYGGFGTTLRTRFQRSNAPFEMKWAAGGTNQQYYRVTPELAAWWRSIRPGVVDEARDTASTTPS